MGTVSFGLPAEVVEGATIVRDLDLDFGTDEFTLTGRIGFGLNGFQLIEVGRFSITYALSFARRPLDPFAETEFDSLFQLATLSSSFDVFAGTDIDELFGNLLGLETSVAGIVETQVRDVLISELASRVRDEVEERFEEAVAPFATLTEDPEATSEEIRATLSFDGERISIDRNNLTVSGFASIWHWLAALGSLDCPANTIVAMRADPRLLRAFRRYEGVSRRKPLAAVRKRYEQHEGELARIVRRDPLLGARTGRLATDLLGVLHHPKETTLSEEAIARARDLVATAAKKASPELKEFLGLIDVALSASVERPLDDLVATVARRGSELPSAG